MRYRTAVKTLRTAAVLQAPAPSRGSFRDYAAMVERLPAGYLRPLTRHQAARRNGF
jgi:hypothetical protein